MKRILILVVVAAAAAAVYFVGPSILMGGPSKSEIVRVSREIMRTTAPDVAEIATITPKGLCNKQGDVFACIVEMTVEGSAPQTLVVELRKDASGKWGAVQ